MELLVRTWNVFHGRTVPESSELHLERMIRLVSEDAPALVGLQEVPVWALARLEAWSGMTVVAARAMPALGGPAARRLTGWDPRRLRSALTGQANALLLGAGLTAAGAQHVLRLNPPALRRRVDLPWRRRLEWARNRRVCQVVPVAATGARFSAVNLHASKGAELARMELERLARLLPEGPAIVCGDLNVPETGLPGFSHPIRGIDQILVRGFEVVNPPTRWPAERRRHAGALLSDHAPVEALVRVRSPGP